jgi:hypothetical protein
MLAGTCQIIGLANGKKTAKFSMMTFSCHYFSILFYEKDKNNPFLFIKHKRLFISSEGFSPLEKKP